MHADDQTLDDLERRALAAFAAAEPPEDFADRIVALAAATGEASEASAAVTVADGPRPEEGRGPGWSSRLGVIGGPLLVAAAVAAGAAALGSLRSPTTGGAGERAPQASVLPAEEIQATALPPAPAGTVPAAPELPADLDRRISDYIGGYGSGWGSSFAFHGSVAVARGGEVLFERSFGEATKAGGEGPPRLRIGSLTGVFTAVAALQLAERGKIDLDGSICGLVPEYCENHQGEEVITPRHLLSHTSGVPNFSDDLYLEIWSLYPRTRGELIAAIARHPLEFAPGSDFDPSNSGYVILGQMIERASGERYEDYVARHILGPAGMVDTGFDVRLGARAVIGRDFNDEVEALEAVSGDNHWGGPHSPANGLFSTARDLVRFDAALARGDLLIAPTMRAMSSPIRDNYGLGWIVGHAFGQRTLGHPGGTSGFNGAILRLEDDGTVAVALANTEVVDCQTVVEDLLSIAHGMRPSAPAEAAEVAAPIWREALVGAYTLSAETRERYAKIIDPGHLAQLDRVVVKVVEGRLRMEIDGHGGKWMHAAGEGRFFFKDGARTTADFELGEEGRVRGMVLRASGASFVLEPVR